MRYLYTARNVPQLLRPIAAKFVQRKVDFFLTLIGLSYERPYLVLDLNLISNLHVTRRITLVNQWITLVNQWITLGKLAVYTCKVLNFRFTSVTLITLLGTVEVTPFFHNFLESCM